MAEPHRVEGDVVGEVAGCDEAGVGCIAGDMIAAAVILPRDCPLPLADSKRLSTSAREGLYDALMQNPHVQSGIGRVTHKEIDDLGMARCRRLVFERALDDLATNSLERLNREPRIRHIIIDGTLFDGWRGVSFECIPRADATIACVSAASILAKVTRDRYMRDLLQQHPDCGVYGWATNMGYPTTAHRKAVVEHGPSPFHRTSFRIRASQDC